MPENIDYTRDMSSTAVVDAFGGPPKEVLDQMNEEERICIVYRLLKRRGRLDY